MLANVQCMRHAGFVVSADNILAAHLGRSSCVVHYKEDGSWPMGM